MRTSLFLAKRYLRPRRNVVSVITLVSVIGVMLGVAILIIVLSVMTGFTDTMKEKLLATQAHFQLQSPWGFREPGPVVEKIRKMGMEAMPVITSGVLVQFGDHFDLQQTTAAFGANPEDFSHRIDLAEVIRFGKFSLEKGEAIISTEMARRWGVSLGDKILLHSPNRLSQLVKLKRDGGIELNPESSVYLPSEFTIAAFYSFGIYSFDRTVLFVNRDDAADLFGYPWGSATAIYGWVNDPFHMSAEMRALSDAFPHYSVSSWEEQNQQMLGVLKVEKRMMFFLLIFIVLVAAFSIANTLITSVYQKTREIGVLKALGASDAVIMRIFILQGMLVGVVGSICGVIFGSAIIYFRNGIMRFVSAVTGQELFPKQFYFFNELPAHIVPGDVILIVVCSIALCTVGAVIPAFSAAKLDPAKALRYE